MGLFSAAPHINPRGRCSHHFSTNEEVVPSPWSNAPWIVGGGIIINPTFSCSLRGLCFPIRIETNLSHHQPTNQPTKQPTKQPTLPFSPAATIFLSLFIALHVPNYLPSCYLHFLISSPILNLFQSGFWHSFVPDPSHWGCHHVVCRERKILSFACLTFWSPFSEMGQREDQEKNRQECMNTGTAQVHVGALGNQQPNEVLGT